MLLKSIWSYSFFAAMAYAFTLLSCLFVCALSNLQDATRNFVTDFTCFPAKENIYISSFPPWFSCRVPEPEQGVKYVQS